MSSRSSIIVNQALHGYAHGHQQLAASLPLKGRDNKTLLVLSDISGPSLQVGPQGYVTGYPLPDAKAYVLAKTWLAPEMPRPGCVWTHSLIVDFSDLPAINDPAALTRLFRRPTDRNVGGFNGKLEISAGPKIGPAEIPPDFGKRLLAALYKYPRSRVVGVRPQGAEIDLAAIDLWTQQWPRLRRSFRFCTLAGTDRSTDGMGFDLQLFPPGDRTTKSRVQNSLDIEEIELTAEDWIEEAYADLARPDARGLRSFMRMMGADLDAGREAFQSLCRLHVLIGGPSSSASDVRNAIALVHDNFSSSPASSIKEIIASRIFEQESFGGEAIAFLVENDELREPKDFVRSWPAFGAALWQYGPSTFIEFAHKVAGRKEGAAPLFSAISIDDLVSGLRLVPGEIDGVLRNRRDLLKSDAFWRFLMASESGGRLINELWPTLDNEEQRLALDTMMTAGDVQVLEQFSERVGSGVLLRILCQAWSAESGARRFERLISSAVKDLNQVAKFLAETSAVPLEFLNEISVRLSPDDVPNDLGDDPWYIAVCGNQNTSKRSTKRFHIWAFLMARALGSRSRNPANLVQCSFELLHDALGANKYSERSWYLLEQRLPWSFPWLKWDRCERLNDAVSALFIDRNLSARIYATICTDDKLFRDLARVTARSHRGREYLRFVGFELGHLGPEMATRHRAVLSLIENPYLTSE